MQALGIPVIVWGFKIRFKAGNLVTKTVSAEGQKTQVCGFWFRTLKNA